VLEARRVSRSKFGPAAGASGGAAPLPAKRLHVPEFLRYTRAEMHAVVNLAGHELAGSLYLLLCIGSVFKGPTAGEVLTTYAHLQAALRPPQPERGKWAPAPTLKRVRTALAALETVGLMHRDTERNAAQGQLRLYLSMRQAAKPTAKVPRKAPGIPADVRAKLNEAREALSHARPIKRQG
jgi:hypothetical protein